MCVFDTLSVHVVVYNSTYCLTDVLKIKIPNTTLSQDICYTVPALRSNRKFIKDIPGTVNVKAL